MKDNKLQTILVLLIVILFSTQSCSGRAAHPVEITQSGDSERTCKSLRRETKQIKRNIKKMIPAIKKADKKRTLLVMPGAFLILPLFFVDYSDADKIEANAQRARYNYLVGRVTKQKCRFKLAKIRKFYFDDKGYKRRNR